MRYNIICMKRNYLKLRLSLVSALLVIVVVTDAASASAAAVVMSFTRFFANGLSLKSE